MQPQFADQKIILHQGVYKPAASVADAVFMITGMTIGAGVLGVPYVVAQVGLKIGIVYILALGLVMLFLNLILGEIAVRTNESLQIPGLAGKYLGKWAKYLLNVVIIFASYGALLAYIIGEGQSLSALFGGNPVVWSVLFWSIGSVIVWRGLQTIKTVEKVLSTIVISIICGLSFYLLKDFQISNWVYSDVSKIFLPYGVILFALNGTAAVVEAHALLPRSQRHFRKALIIGSLIPVAVYTLFALAVVGTSGLGTAEIATIGLGAKFGNAVLILGNIFAVLAMAGGFIGSGIALKQNFVWDNKINKILAEFLVISVPLLLFLAGLRQFISILSVAGGVFIGIEAIILIIVCWQARRKGDIDATRYGLHYFWLFAVPVFLIFTWITITNFIKILW